MYDTCWFEYKFYFNKNLIFQKAFELKIGEFGLKMLDKIIWKIADKSLFLQQMDGL